MSAMAYQITALSSTCSTVCSGADQGKHQSSASLAFVKGIHHWPVVTHHKGPGTRKMFTFDDVIMKACILYLCSLIWVNNGEAGDSRRHRAHCDVIVIVCYTAMALCFQRARCWSIGIAQHSTKLRKLCGGNTRSHPVVPVGHATAHSDTVWPL